MPDVIVPDNYLTEVHVINVGQGDSSLILVKNETKGNVIEKAILIDGGEKGKGDKVKAYLEKEYQKSPFFLDAIVVTHFDADHLGGIYTLLKDNEFLVKYTGGRTLSLIKLQDKPEPQVIEDQIGQLKLKLEQEATRDVDKKIKKTIYGVVFYNQGIQGYSYKFCYLDNDSNFNANDTSYKELEGDNSTSSYWKELHESFKANKFLNNKEYSFQEILGIIKTDIKKITIIDYLSKLLKITNRITYIYDTVTKPEKQTEIYLDYNVLIKNHEYVQRFDNSQLAQLNTLLGYELFWNDGLASINHWKPLQNATLKALRQSNEKSANKPALFCIAVNQAVLQIIPGGGTPTNKSSIALVLISSGNVDNPGQILYYTGGDLPDEIESSIVKWMKAQLGNNPLPAFKFSHHGAKTSTSRNFFELNPNYGMLTAGSCTCKKTIQYTHPSLELLIYLFYYNTFLANASPPIIICATNFPFYFLESYQEGFFDKFQKVEAFRTDLSKLKKELDDLSNKDANCNLSLLLDTDKLTKVGFTAAINYIYNKFWVKSCSPRLLPTTLVPDQQIDESNIVLSFNPSLNVQIETFALSICTSKPHRNSVRSTKRIAQNPRARKKSFLKICDNSDNYTIYYGSDSDPNSRTIAGIQLMEGTPLDKFVNNLHEKSLKIVIENSCDISLTITGNVHQSDELQKWFSEFSIENINVTMECVLQEGTLRMIPVNIKNFVVDLAKDGLGIDKTIKLQTAITKDEMAEQIFNFKLSQPATANIEKYMAHWNFSSFPIKLICKLFNINEDGIEIDIDKTQIIFSPAKAYKTEFILATKLVGVSNLKNFGINNPVLALHMVTYPSMGNYLNFECGSYIFCDFELKDIKVATTLQLDFDGYGSLSFSLNENDKKGIDILVDLFNFKIPTFPFNIILQSVTVNFDLNKVRIINLNTECTVTLGLLKLNTYFSLPNFSMWGNLEEEYILNNLLTKLGCNITSTGLEKFCLSNIDFCFNFSENYYSLTFDLKDVKENQICWNIAEIGIKIEDIEFKLIKHMNSWDVEISSCIQVSNDYVLLKGQYQYGNWAFSAEITSINIAGLINSFLPESSKNFFTTVIPTSFEFKELKLTLSIENNSTTLYLSGLLFIEISGKQQEISFQYSYLNKASYFNFMWKTKEGYGLVELVNLFTIDIDITDFNFKINDVTLTYCTDQFKYLKGEFKVADSTLALMIVYDENDKFSIKKLFLANLKLPDIIKGCPIIGSLPNPVNSVQLIFATPLPFLSQDKENFKIIAKTISLSDITIFENLIENISKKNLRFNIKFIEGFPIKDFELPSIESQSINQSLEQQPVPVVSESESSVQWRDLNRTIGPISIARMGFQYKNQLWVLFDAKLNLGVFALQIDGFGVGFEMTKMDVPVFTISGLGLNVKISEISLFGDFCKIMPPGENLVERYYGEIAVTTPAFSLMAAGSYSKFESGDTSIFIFAMLNAALGGPPFLFITGLTSGFGYNQKFRIPNIEEIETCPLVAGCSNPAAILGNKPYTLANIAENLQDDSKGEPVLKPSVGDYWAAIGLEFTTFELLSTSALLVVSFGHDLSIALLGYSKMQMPKTGKPMLNIGLSMLAAFKPLEGILKLEGRLSSSSYLLNSNCHLTGGFAFYAWFPPNEQAGDFVITLGGYHPKFESNLPAWYPKVPRLGLNWSVSDNLTIRGETYFALTSSCVMAGIDYSAVFVLGNLRAWFKAYADFIINWLPFHYEAEAAISIGASYDLNLWLTTMHFSIEMGANLNLWGPPFGGKVYVDWNIISFTIHFGEEPQEEVPAVNWNEFQQLLPQSKDKKDANSKLQSTLIADCKIQRGLIREVKKEGKTYWIVRADELHMQTESSVPITKITLNEKPVGTTQGTLNIRPMGKKDVISDHVITINADNQGTNWRFEPYQRKLPEALWGDPGELKQGKPAKPKLGNELLEHTVGVDIIAPAAELQGGLAVSNSKQAFDHEFVKDKDNKELDSVVLPIAKEPEQSTVPTPITKEDITNKLKQSSLTINRNTLFAYLEKNSRVRTNAKIIEIPELIKQVDNWPTEKLLMR